MFSDSVRTACRESLTGGVQGRRLGGGPGGSGPGSSWVSVFSRCREKLFLPMFSVQIGLTKTNIYLTKIKFDLMHRPMIFIDRTHSKNSNAEQQYNLKASISSGVTRY